MSAAASDSFSLMPRPLSFLATVMFAACIGCSPSGSDRIEERRLTDLPTKRVELGREWRDVREVPANGTYVIDLGPIPARGVLRLGLAVGGSGSSKGSIDIYAGERLVHSLWVDEPGAWTDVRVELGASASGKHCRLQINSSNPVWLGPIETIDVGARREKQPPNVLIFLIDTLRLDHVGCYGYSRDTTPHIDAFAAEGALFTQLMPPSSWTRPSVASLLTSMYPNIHGAKNRLDKLREDLPSLPRALAEEGYETHCFMTNPNCLPVWGFGDDFFRFVDVDSAKYKTVGSDAKAVDRAMAALEHVQGRPWFFYVHVMGPHNPYEPPEGYRNRFKSDTSGLNDSERHVRETVDRYDEEIVYSDALFGRLLERLKELDLYDNTAIVLLSDHGEEFMEHGHLRHAKSLYEEVLRVPLIIKPPLGAWTVGGRIESLVEMVDIAPTLLEIAGAAVPERFQGNSFLGLLRGEAESPRTGYASLNIDRFSFRAVKTIRHKFVRDLVAHEDRWYDLESDPAEKNPLDTLPSWGEDLQRYAIRKSMEGAHGVHLLVVGGETARDVTVVLSGPRMGSPELDFYAWKNELHGQENVVRLKLFDEVLESTPLRANEIKHSRQLHAHVRIPLEEARPIAVHVLVDGETMVRESESPRDRGVWRVSGDRTYPLSDIVADPDSFDLGSLPRDFGIYIWFVPDAERVVETDVDPEIIEALRALGYMD